MTNEKVCKKLYMIHTQNLAILFFFEEEMKRIFKAVNMAPRSLGFYIVSKNCQKVFKLVSFTIPWIIDAGSGVCNDLPHWVVILNIALF